MNMPWQVNMFISMGIIYGGIIWCLYMVATTKEAEE